MPDEREHLKIVTPEVEQQLNKEEEEFRKLRRDLPGVKGAAAAGIISIAVGKLPGRNVFYRTHPHPDFQPVLNVVNDVAGLEKVFYVVAPAMVMPLASIGIICRDYRMYFTQTVDGKLVVVPVICPDENGARNSYDATREEGLRDGMDRWVRLWADQRNQRYRVFPAPEGRYPEKVMWPDLPYYKVFNHAFKTKGLQIDDTNHPMFLKWSGREKSAQ